MDDPERLATSTRSADAAMSPTTLKLILSYTVEDRRRADADGEHQHRRREDAVDGRQTHAVE